MADAPRLLDHLSDEDTEHFAAVRGLLDAAGVAHEVDPALVRGLDYYTRTVFEFTSDALGAQSGVGGGGRYDGLIEQLGGPRTPGMGWAAGVERILLAAGEQREKPILVDLFIAFSEEHRTAAFKLSMDARHAGMNAQMELAGRSLKGQRKQADRIGARWLAVLGDEGASLRDMESGEEAEVPVDRVVAQAMRGFTP